MYCNVHYVEGNEYISNAKVYGLKDSIKAAKYPMSADINKVDSSLTKGIVKLAQCGTGEGHDQFLTGIIAQFDLTFSNKAWVEAERYHFFDFVSSQSTMHRIAKFDMDSSFSQYVDTGVIDIVKRKIEEYNQMIEEGADKGDLNIKYLEILYNNPAGFRLTARMTTNYRQLKTIYHQRRTHRLPDWQGFCDWIETLPASFLITGEEHEIVVGNSPTAIAISGHAGSGKDTVAMMIEEKLAAKGYRVLVTHYADLLKYVCRTYFGWNGMKDAYGRQLLQQVGTNVVRRKYPDFWVEFIARIIGMFGDLWDFVLVPDARFPNEISGLEDRKINTIHIGVSRDNYESKLTPEQQLHESETALDGVEPDFSIKNNGTIKQLDDMVDKLLEEILADE